MDNKLLSDHEMYILLENAEILRKNGKYEEALVNYDVLINNSNPQAFYYRNRAQIYDNLLKFQKAIEDIKSAIRMNPDNAEYYWLLGGYLVSNEMMLHGKITKFSSKKVFEDAALFYHKSLEKDPINECAWINLIEISLFANKWDDAICYFGVCKPYIKTLAFQLIRSFLGSLALILSDEEIDTDILTMLNDSSIRISNEHYRVCEIESLIFELEKSGGNAAKIIRVTEIYKLFMSHYDDEPRRYGKNNKISFDNIIN